MLFKLRKMNLVLINVLFLDLIAVFLLCSIESVNCFVLCGGVAF